MPLLVNVLKCFLVFSGIIQCKLVKFIEKRSLPLRSSNPRHPRDHEIAKLSGPACRVNRIFSKLKDHCHKITQNVVKMIGTIDKTIDLMKFC